MLKVGGLNPGGSYCIVKIIEKLFFMSIRMRGQECACAVVGKDLLRMHATSIFRIFDPSWQPRRASARGCICRRDLYLSAWAAVVHVRIRMRRPTKKGIFREFPMSELETWLRRAGVPIQTWNETTEQLQKNMADAQPSNWRSKRERKEIKKINFFD